MVERPTAEQVIKGEAPLYYRPGPLPVPYIVHLNVRDDEIELREPSTDAEARPRMMTTAAPTGSVWDQTLAFCTNSAMRLPPNGATELTLDIMFQSNGNTNTNGMPLFGTYQVMCAYMNNSVVSISWGKGSVNPTISMTPYFDGNPHHFEMSGGPAGLFCFIDGEMIYQNTSTTLIGSGASIGGFQMGYRADGSYVPSGGPLVMNLASFAIWSIQRHTAAFTPPTTYYTGMEPGLLGYWPMNGDTNERL